MRIRGGSPATQISVTDAEFRAVPLEQNAGFIELELPAGMYKVRFQEGTRTEEQMVLLLPDGVPVEVVQEAPVLFESAVPLDATSTTHEYQMGPAVDLSVADPHTSVGLGAQLTVFARDPGIPEPRRGRGEESKQGLPSDVADRLEMVQAIPMSSVDDPVGPTDPTIGLTLHDVYGAEIAAVSEGTLDLGARFGGIKCEVDPGTYRLRVDTGMGYLLEMPVVCISGWQTMIFLLTRDFTEPVGTDRADLDKASVSLLAAGSNGFQPFDESSRLTELALQALAGQRSLRGADLREILYEKFTDPMLGLYGAHLLLTQEEPDLDFVTTVIGNTENLIPEHPDVTALWLKRALLRDELPDPVPVFETPPMLSASWQAVVAATRLDASIVPLGSLSDLISDRVARSGPWLVWANPPELDDEVPDEFPESVIFEAAETVESLLVSLADASTQEWAKGSDGLSSVQQVLAEVIVPAFDPVTRRLLDKRDQLEPREAPLEDEISTDMNIPVNSVRRLASELDKKIKGR
jgi:hypothetical protein